MTGHGQHFQGLGVPALKCSAVGPFAASPRPDYWACGLFAAVPNAKHAQAQPHALTTDRSSLDDQFKHLAFTSSCCPEEVDAIGLLLKIQPLGLTTS